MIRKMVFFIFVVASLLKANETLIIDANKFEADDKKGYTLFTGDVKVKKANDELNSDKLEVYLKKTNGKSEPTKYVATGNVTFKVKSSDKVFEGKGNKLIYDVNSLKYTIIGNGYIKELNGDKTLYGDKIYLDQNSGEAKVEGKDNKPVRFIMTIENKGN